MHSPAECLDFTFCPRNFLCFTHNLFVSRDVMDYVLGLQTPSELCSRISDPLWTLFSYLKTFQDSVLVLKSLYALCPSAPEPPGLLPQFEWPACTLPLCFSIPLDSALNLKGLSVLCPHVSEPHWTLSLI
jgi:hypothetical protein